MEEAKLGTRQIWGKKGLHTREICIADELGTCWGILDTNFVVFTRAAQENRTDCAWPGVGTESTDKRPPCWFLLLPLHHLPSSVVVCSRANCSYPELLLFGFKEPSRAKNQLPTSPYCCVLLSFSTLPNRLTPPFPWLYSCPQTFNLSASMVKFCSDGAILAN